MVAVAIISLTAVIFGIAALLLASKARNRLCPGSLKSYIDNFSICLTFIVIFSLWQATRSVFNIELSLGKFSDYPELIFIVFAYIGFIIASFRVMKISEEFGFKSDGKLICKLIEKPKKKNK